jgi:hypothetical protein
MKETWKRHVASVAWMCNNGIMIKDQKGFKMDNEQQLKKESGQLDSREVSSPFPMSNDASDAPIPVSFDDMLSGRALSSIQADKFSRYQKVLLSGVL